MSGLEGLTDEGARTAWTWGGFGTDADYPGQSVAELRMLRGVTRSGRRALARLFASVAPRSGAVAVAALLWSRRSARPASIPTPVRPAPVRLSPQRRSTRITPARAP